MISTKSDGSDMCLTQNGTMRSRPFTIVFKVTHTHEYINIRVYIYIYACIDICAINLYKEDHLKLTCGAGCMLKCLWHISITT